MSTYLVTDTDLTTVADAIRTKGGTSASLEFPDGFVDAVEAIETGGGGGLPAKLISYQEFTPASVITSDNKMNIQLEAVDACVIIVIKKVYPNQPNASGSTALAWNRILNGAASYSRYGRLLRTDGTIGSDANMCLFNASTGVLSVGGQYGYFFPGETYEVFQIAIW